MRWGGNHERGTHPPAIGWLQLSTVALLAVALSPHRCNAYAVMLRWTVPKKGVVGYRVHAGSQSGSYNQNLDVGALAGATLNGVVYYFYPDVPSGTTAYVAVTAYNGARVESDYSNEKQLTPAVAPPVNAGLDQSATTGSSVTLGSAGQAGLSYFWEQIAGPPVTLADRTASSTRIRVQAAGVYTFALTAYDAQGVAARDLVTVSVADSRTPTPAPVDSLAIRGNRRSPRTDIDGCQVEWFVVNGTAARDRYGLLSQKQVCEDGDPGCDFQPDTPEICEFRVTVCLNNADPALPACVPNGVARIDVLAPRVRTSAATESAAILASDRAALDDALNHLQDPQESAGEYTHAPPLDAAQEGFCSAPFPIQARAVNRSTLVSVTLKTRSADNSQPRARINVSQLQLTCTRSTQ